MKTAPSPAYESAVQHLVSRGLSHDAAVRMLARYAQGRLVDNAHALERHGIEYVVAYGALSAARGDVLSYPDDIDPSRGLSATTLLILGIMLGGITYSLSQSSSGYAADAGEQASLIIRGLFSASAACLVWAAFKWLRP